MSAAVTIDRVSLGAAAGDVERLLDDADPADIILRLVHVHGGSYRDANNTYALRVAGVRKSCTAGPISLLREWLAKAKHVLSEGDGANHVG